MTWTPSDTTDAIQSVVGLALSFANDGLLQFARGGSLMETVYQNCTTGRSNLFESHRQRRWLTVVSYLESPLLLHVRERTGITMIVRIFPARLTMKYKGPYHSYDMDADPSLDCWLPAAPLQHYRRRGATRHRSPARRRADPRRSLRRRPRTPDRGALRQTPSRRYPDPLRLARCRLGPAHESCQCGTRPETLRQIVGTQQGTTIGGHYDIGQDLGSEPVRPFMKRTGERLKLQNPSATS